MKRYRLGAIEIRRWKVQLETQRHIACFLRCNRRYQNLVTEKIKDVNEKR